ncbi:hypothetical protein [Sorangium sp. So ce1335]
MPDAARERILDAGEKANRRARVTGSWTPIGPVTLNPHTHEAKALMTI